MKPRVGLIGVGAMGMGVAKALLSKGFIVVVRDLIADRENEAVAAGARRAPTPAEVAAQVDVLITLVVDATQTREVLSVIPAPATVIPAKVVMMCSTIAPTDAEAIAADLRARGTPMLDAPISGGPARAHAGTLSMMAAGRDDAFALAREVIEATTSKCFRISARPGDGSRMKIVNNMLAAANLAAGCEAMVAAARLGLDLPQAADVINASSGASWIFADRMPRALAGDYAPRAAARVLKKDISLFVEAARALRLDVPMAEAAKRVFAEAVEQGFGEEDDAVILKRYAALADVALPT